MMRETTNLKEIPSFLKKTGREINWATIPNWARKIHMKKSKYEEYMAKLGCLKPIKDECTGKITYYITREGVMHCHTVQGIIGRKTLWDYDTFSKVAMLQVRNSEVYYCCTKCKSHLNEENEFDLLKTPYVCKKCGHTDEECEVEVVFK